MLLDTPPSQEANIDKEGNLNTLAKLPKFFRVRLENIKNDQMNKN
jgi:hypothetical protein